MTPNTIDNIVNFIVNNPDLPFKEYKGGEYTKYQFSRIKNCLLNKQSYGSKILVEAIKFNGDFEKVFFKFKDSVISKNVKYVERVYKSLEGMNKLGFIKK